MATKRKISAEEMSVIIQGIPNCIVKNCPNERAIKDAIKTIMNVRECIGVNAETLLVADNYPKTRNRYFDDFESNKMIKSGRIWGSDRELPLSSITKTNHYRGKDKLVIAIEELSDVGSPKFDKELWCLLKNDTKKRICFIGFTQMQMVSQVKLKTSLDVLEVYDYEIFKGFITGETSIASQNDADSSVSSKVNYDDLVDGHSFEAFCADLLQKNGFENVVVTSGSGDQGIDILCRKEEVKYGIQCKCYSKDIGNKAVQEAYSGAQFYNCHVPVVLTNRDFTPAAREAAERTNVILWNRQKLDQLIKKAEENKSK